MVFEQQFHQIEPCFVEARIECKRGLQRVVRVFTAAFGDGHGRFGARRFRAVGHEAIEKLAQLAFRQHADELIDGPSVREGDDVRNAAHLEVRGQFLVLVDVHLHETPFAFVLGFELCEHRAERLARSAPRRPEVDQYGREHRCADDVLFEGGESGVHCNLFLESVLEVNRGGRRGFNARLRFIWFHCAFGAAPADACESSAACAPAAGSIPFRPAPCPFPDSSRRPSRARSSRASSKRNSIR